MLVGGVHMIGERLDIRLDVEHRRRLDVVAVSQGATISDAVRSMIDRAYEEGQRAERLRAAEELAAMTIDDDVLEPDELSRYLEGAHAIPDLY